MCNVSNPSRNSALLYQSSKGTGTCGYLRTPQTEILRKRHDAFDTTLQLCENRFLHVVILCTQSQFISGSSVKVFLIANGLRQHFNNTFLESMFGSIFGFQKRMLLHLLEYTKLYETCKFFQSRVQNNW